MCYLWDFYGPVRAGTLLVGFQKDWKVKNSACNLESGSFHQLTHPDSSNISSKSVGSNQKS